MTDKPRLIEVAFPLRQASVASVHEKNVRHGHISTLHIWPARRPLAACRAALLATLLPDPGDPEKRQALLDAIGGRVVTEQKESLDDDGQRVVEDKEVVKDGVLAWGQENTEMMETFRKQIREFYGGKAPRVLDPFSGGGAIPLEAMRLGCEVTASDLNPVAWFILKCTLDYPQRFAGKTWPLPSFVSEWRDFTEDFLAGKVTKKKGKEPVGFEVNPQPSLDGKKISPDALPPNIRLTDDFSALPPANLAWHVRAWGRWVLERARQDLASRYPVIDGEPTLAYLWARTARDKSEPFARIPLLKTFWLCKKRGRRCAIIPAPSADGKSVTFRLIEEAFFENDKNEWSRLLRESYPHLEAWGVDGDNLTGFLDRGTMNRAGVWSPCSGRPTTIALTMEDLRFQGQNGLLGTQMTVVVFEQTEIIVREDSKGRQKETRKTRKRYRLPLDAEIASAAVDVEDLEDVFDGIPHGIPNEPTPAGGGSGAARAFSLHRYGLKTWRDLFTSRQLLTLGVFTKHTRAAIQRLRSENAEIAEFVGSYLALILNRVADRDSALCSWTIDYDQVRNTFARFAMGITWDFCECNVLVKTSGGYPGQLELVAQYCEHAGETMGTPAAPNVLKRSATDSHGEIELLVTDPPYYDAIPYSDLMDFFYIWLKRVLSGHGYAHLDENFSSLLSPKWNREINDGELIDDESRFEGNRKASKQSYEDGMARAFSSCLSSLPEHGRLVVVFANKEVDAWETLVSALIRAGAVVTASWPIQSERAVRVRGLGSAALSSSVWIVCRKRARETAPGWDEHVLEAMQAKLFEPRPELGEKNILQYYFDQGIIGPDFLWAALGPALEAYSAHPFVRKADGSGAMTVADFLGEVRKLVLQFALGRLLHADGLNLDPVTQFYLLHRSTFGITPAPAGPCILYAMSCGKNLGELQMVWKVLAQGGKKRGKQKSDDDAESGASEDDVAETKGNELVLVGWQERGGKEDIGEPKGGHPSPLIDRVQRLLVLLHQGRASDVQQLFNQWALASEPAFKPLLQALRELALRDKQDLECRMVEALATTLNMNTRRVVTPEGTVKETPLFESVEIETRPPDSKKYPAKKRKNP